MFPIKDHNPSGRVPYVTYALMAVNIIVFLSYWPLSDERTINAFFAEWAMVPVLVVEYGAFETLFTSMFLHGGWMHLAGNMLFLFIFGDNIEDEMGHVGYLLFYIASGLGAAALHLASDPYSTIPTVGASGAIAGVMGGYMLLYPKARVDVLLIFVIFFRIVPVPAWIMLGLWLGFQIFGAALTDPSGGGIAYWAHAGGFFVGLLLTLPLFLKRGGTGFWRETEGHPPHPEAEYRFARTRIPRVTRK